MPDDEELTRLEEEIGRLVTAYVTRRSEKGDYDDYDPPPGVPYVTGWVVGYEFTSTQLEAEQAVGRGVIVPDSQMVSASEGLGHYATRAFS